MGGRVLLEELIADVRFAWRTLRRRPAFSLVAVLVIALSIGTATAIYTIVDSVLFRGIPARGAGTLVAVWQTIPEWRTQPVLAYTWDRTVLDYPDFRAWRDRQTSFGAVAAWTNASAMLWSGDRPEQVLLTRASPALLSVLGAAPALGRFFLPGEDAPGGPNVTVISYDTWQSRFAGRADVLSQTVSLDSVTYQIVGVLPKDFALTRGVPARPFFVPSGQSANDTPRGNHSFRAIGRLKPGISMAQASAEADQLLGGATDRPGRGIHLVEYQDDETRTVRSPLLLLLMAAITLLLIGTLNIATLLLGESTSREREMSARVALGATRGRLVRQLLTESTLVAALGAAAGVGVARWMVKGLAAIAPSSIPAIRLASIDARVLAVTVAVTVMTGIAFGSVPALSLSIIAPTDLLRGSRNIGPRRVQLPTVLMAAQVAMSVVLLVGAGLVSRSLRELSRVDPGFRTANIEVVMLAYPGTMLAQADLMHAQYDAILPRLAALPGVTSVAGANMLPFDGGSATSEIQLPGDSALGIAAPRREVNRRFVTPSYFETLGIPLLAGRRFTDADRTGAPFVMIVSESTARRDWPNEPAVGKLAKFQGQWQTVVGVVGDTKRNTLADDLAPTAYAPAAQSNYNLRMVVRARSDPTLLVPAIRAAIGSVSPLAQVTLVSTMDDLVRASMAEERFRTTLVDVFGVMAVVLAAIGLYGLTARAVARRTQEAGIRMALGATAASVRGLIVGHAMAIVGVGSLVGVALAIPVTRVLTPYLFHTATGDPATYAGTAVVLACAALVASGLPARRLGRVDPAVVLRGE